MATQKSMGQEVSSPMPWPKGLRKTPIRQKWHAMFSKCAPALSLQELAECLAQPYASVAFWAKALNYRFRMLKRGRKSQINWDGLDWSLRNSELARQVGVTGERVRQIRKRRNLPPSRNGLGEGRKSP